MAITPDGLLERRPAFSIRRTARLAPQGLYLGQNASRFGVPLAGCSMAREGGICREPVWAVARMPKVMGDLPIRSSQSGRAFRSDSLID